MLLIIPDTKLFFEEVGDVAKFTGRFFRQSFKKRLELTEFLRQCFIIGYKSLPLVGLTSFIMGLVLTMQLRPSMVDYGVESQLPAIVGISISGHPGFPHPDPGCFFQTFEWFLCRASINQ